MIETTGKKLTVLVFSALLAALFAMGGCSSQQPASSSASSSSASSSSASSSSVEDEAVDADIVIGKESDDATCVMLTNETGASIDGIGLVDTTETSSSASADASAETAPVELMASGQSWADDETAAVYVDPQGTGKHDVQLKIGKDTYVLHSFNFDLITEASIRLSDGIAYVTYDQFGAEKSTLDAETAIFEEAQAAAAEAKAAEEAQEAAEAEAAEEEYVYEEPAATSAPAQSSDSCIDGGVALR